MRSRHLVYPACLFAMAIVGWAVQPLRAASPSAAQALRLTPSQDGVDYDRPKPEDVPRCKVTAKKINGHVGWIVESPEGVLLRKFVDTDGDNIVDQWSYYKDGVEVYREVATHSGSKPDQFRWLNTAGTRWGLSAAGDGKISAWKAISAEEASAEIVAALASGDADRFARVLLTSDEAGSLGLSKARADALAAQVAKAATEFRELADRKALPADANWLQFSANRPATVPAGTDGLPDDLEVYENAVALVQSGEKSTQVQIGELVHVGKTWKVIDAPKLSIDGQPAVAMRSFFESSLPVARSVGAVAAVDNEVQTLIAELGKLDPTDPRRLEILQNIIDHTKTAEDRTLWTHQLVDTLSNFVQAGSLPDAEKRLQAFFDKASADGDRNLAAYIKIRLMTARYARDIANAKDFQKVQTQWTKDLEQFIEDYPKCADAAEAMLQLGTAKENIGQDDDAKKWYERVGSEFPDAPQAKKAAGAVRRLSCVGTVLQLSGKGLDGQTIDLASYRGKAVLIQYWATWCKPAVNDMAALKQLASKYNRTFTVLGVSLDNKAADLKSYLAENPLPWEQIYEEGGQDGPPANALGIITVPTMILIDTEGKVISRNIQAADIEAELKKLKQ